MKFQMSLFRVASVSSDPCWDSSHKGCAPLGTYRVEETKGFIDGIEIVGLQGVAMLMAIMGAMKAMMCTQCHVTPHGKLHGRVQESQETQWELTVPMERPTR